MKLVLFLSAFAVVALMGNPADLQVRRLNTFDIVVLRETGQVDEHPVLGTTLDKIICS